MIVLDTDHFSILRYTDHPRYFDLTTRLLTCSDRIATTVVTLEEQLRGWLADIHGEKRTLAVIPIYDRLAGIVKLFEDWEVLRFDEQAAQRFDQICKGSVGVLDRRIAAITLAHSATLLTANRKDFQKIPGLRFENWLS